MNVSQDNKEAGMLRTILRLTTFLVGGHLLFGLILMVIKATHGINDQDPSFAVALLFYYLNFPAVCLLRHLGTPPETIPPVILVGILQWGCVASVIAAVYYPFRSRPRMDTLQESQAPEQSGGHERTETSGNESRSSEPRM